VPVDNIHSAVERRGSFNVIHLETMRKVDVFVLRDAALDQQELERRQSTVIIDDPPQSVYLPTPEDLILQKLEWYRRGGARFYEVTPKVALPRRLSASGNRSARPDPDDLARRMAIERGADPGDPTTPELSTGCRGCGTRAF